MKLILCSTANGLFMWGVTMLPFFQMSKTVAADPSTGKVMWSDQSLVYKGETLTLQFTTPHEKHLGVINPDGQFFYVIFPSSSCSGNLKPLMDSKDFAETRTLQINTATFKADPYRYGVYDNQSVFTKSGTYRFVLGDNLSVHDEAALSVLKIEYRTGIRPANQGRDIIRA